jgi:hypothetical protein
MLPLCNWWQQKLGFFNKKNWRKKRKKKKKMMTYEYVLHGLSSRDQLTITILKICRTFSLNATNLHHTHVLVQHRPTQLQKTDTGSGSDSTIMIRQWILLTRCKNCQTVKMVRLTFYFLISPYNFSFLHNDHKLLFFFLHYGPLRVNTSIELAKCLTNGFGALTLLYSCLVL